MALLSWNEMIDRLIKGPLANSKEEWKEVVETFFSQKAFYSKDVFERDLYDDIADGRINVQGLVHLCEMARCRDRGIVLLVLKLLARLGDRVDMLREFVSVMYSSCGHNLRYDILRSSHTDAECLATLRAVEALEVVRLRLREPLTELGLISEWSFFEDVASKNFANTLRFLIAEETAGTHCQSKSVLDYGYRLGKSLVRDAMLCGHLEVLEVLDDLGLLWLNIVKDYVLPRVNPNTRSLECADFLASRLGTCTSPERQSTIAWLLVREWHQHPSQVAAKAARFLSPRMRGTKAIEPFLQNLVPRVLSEEADDAWKLADAVILFAEEEEKGTEPPMSLVSVVACVLQQHTLLLRHRHEQLQQSLAPQEER